MIQAFYRGSVNQCIHGKVYLRPNLSRKRTLACVYTNISWKDGNINVQYQRDTLNDNLSEQKHENTLLMPALHNVMHRDGQRIE